MCTYLYFMTSVNSEYNKSSVNTLYKFYFSFQWFYLKKSNNKSLAAVKTPLVKLEISRFILRVEDLS